MYLLFGAEAAFQNILTLALPYSKGKKISTVEELGAVYSLFLEKYGYLEKPSEAMLPFIEDPGLKESLLKTYGLHPNATERSMPCPPESIEQLKQQLIAGWKLLATSMSPEFSELFGLVIRGILIDPWMKSSQEGLPFFGSSPKVLGVLWLSPAALLSQSPHDFAELLLHEFTHHLLFIEECCDGLYDYERIQTEALTAFSATLMIERPADRAFHSLVVVTELALARRLNSTGASAPLMHGTDQGLHKRGKLAAEALLALHSQTAFLTARALEILLHCQAVLLSCETERRLKEAPKRAKHRDA